MDEQQNTAAEPQATPLEVSNEDELAKAKAQADEYLAGWKRAMADYANLKKEAERAQGELAKYAAAGLMTQLLPPLENFKKAAAQTPKMDEVKCDSAAVRQWVGGIDAIRSQLESVLKGVGVTVIDAVDVPFDPAKHEAMMAEKHGNAEPGTVIKMLEPGYMMHDRVLKPAKVVVAE